ncbi:MAG: FadR family transcriptional regulator, partial [Alphaproteobacteria bacterium]|nr:FadR family transcriptional regulator [Alphaproteobacteria bacterium]
MKIAQGLADQITAGEYLAGDRLPPERELSVKLAVSRTIVREALLALEIMRFVEIRVGSGVFVLPEALRDHNRGELFNDEDVGPWEVLEARRVVEGKAAYFAALNADDDILGQLEAEIDKMQASVDDIPRFDRADKAFHALIARASGNSLFESYL